MGMGGQIGGSCAPSLLVIIFPLCSHSNSVYEGVYQGTCGCDAKASPDRRLVSACFSDLVVLCSISLADWVNWVVGVIGVMGVIGVSVVIGVSGVIRVIGVIWVICTCARADVPNPRLLQNA